MSYERYLGRSFDILDKSFTVSDMLVDFLKYWEGYETGFGLSFDGLLY